ncbi:putative ABC transporter permease [Butyrivibrio proteoclasticus]|uniref:putative ABC transporter permease n=1 Tax=Butyrivibrio proteoclasticus TaxID=43305 RepID=UPI00068576AE|nr:putative ABC transporter permease [Butyrivibrio proteoclasticus]
MNTKVKKLRHLAEMWLTFCFGGWVYESIWVSMVEQVKGFVNRGFLFGPWIPIYGFGMFIIIPIIKKLKLKTWFPVFCLGAVLATSAELIGSYVCDILIGKPLWSYETYFANFQGRIAFKPACTFGLLTILGYFVAMPWLDKINEKYENTAHNVITFGLFALFAVDVIARFLLGSNM